MYAICPGCFRSYLIKIVIGSKSLASVDTFYIMLIRVSKKYSIIGPDKDSLCTQNSIYFRIHQF